MTNSECGLAGITEHVAAISVEDYLARYVDFEATEARCRECGNYGKGWRCPPFDFDPREVWRRYRTFMVCCWKMPTKGLSDSEVIPAFFEAKARFDERMLELERSQPGSLAISAGFCNRCETCTRAAGKPCRMPEKARYSIEALGGIMDRTVRDLLGFDVLWGEAGKQPEYYTLAGGLLLRSDTPPIGIK